MYACNVYDVTDAFAENIRQETLDNVRRLRHHACLGLWCGNNEIESAWDHWGDFQKETPYLRADYVKQFEQILPHAVREADPDTFYWPSSPSSGGCFDEPDSEGPRGYALLGCMAWTETVFGLPEILFPLLLGIRLPVLPFL